VAEGVERDEKLEEQLWWEDTMVVGAEEQLGEVAVGKRDEVEGRIEGEVDWQGVCSLVEDEAHLCYPVMEAKTGRFQSPVVVELAAGGAMVAQVVH